MHFEFRDATDCQSLDVAQCAIAAPHAAALYRDSRSRTPSQWARRIELHERQGRLVGAVLREIEGTRRGGGRRARSAGDVAW